MATPSSPQTVELAQHLLGVLDEQVLGDFELQAVRLSPVSCSTCATVSAMSPSRNCAGERLTAMVRAPGHCDRVAARAPQHPFAERHDEPGILGHRDEMARRDPAVHRVVPADERLRRRTGVSARKIVLRLIDDLELLAAERQPSSCSTMRRRCSALSMLCSKKHMRWPPSPLARASAMPAWRSIVAALSPSAGASAMPTLVGAVISLPAIAADGAAPRPGGS